MPRPSAFRTLLPELKLAAATPRFLMYFLAEIWLFLALRMSFEIAVDPEYLGRADAGTSEIVPQALTIFLVAAPVLAALIGLVALPVLAILVPGRALVVAIVLVTIWIEGMPRHAARAFGYRSKLPRGMEE